MINQLTLLSYIYTITYERARTCQVENQLDKTLSTKLFLKSKLDFKRKLLRKFRLQIVQFCTSATKIQQLTRQNNAISSALLTHQLSIYDNNLPAKFSWKFEMHFNSLNNFSARIITQLVQQSFPSVQIQALNLIVSLQQHKMLY